MNMAIRCKLVKYRSAGGKKTLTNKKTAGILGLSGKVWYKVG